MSEGPYILEIYEPGSFYDTLVRFSSALPFMSIHAGDIINPANWPAYDDTSTVLRVVGVEHIIWEITTPKHKWCIRQVFHPSPQHLRPACTPRYRTNWPAYAITTARRKQAGFTGCTNKVCIFTEAVENSAENRDAHRWRDR